MLHMQKISKVHSSSHENFNYWKLMAICVINGGEK
jgi:hypothetical protein